MYEKQLHPEQNLPEHLDSLDHEDSLRLHSLLITRATDIIREKISKGEYDNLSSEELFHHMYDTHVTGGYESRHSIYHIIAMFEPTRYDPVIERHVKLTLSEAIRYQTHQAFQGNQFGGFEPNSLRKGEMKMVRDNTMLGVPRACLTDISEHLFRAIDSYIASKKDESIYDQEEVDKRVSISLTFAILLDFFHLKPDCNGRTSEDFMVQLQRKLLNRDMKQVRTWSQHSLRAKEVGSVITENYRPIVEKRDRSMGERSVAMASLRENIYAKLTQAFQSNQLLPTNQLLSDEVLKRHPEVVTKFFESLLDEIAQTPETFLNSTFNEYGFDKVAAALRRCSPPDEQGSHYKYESIDFYKSHTDAKEVFSRLRNAVILEQNKQKMKEQRDSEFEKLITTIDKASEVIEKILNRIMEKVISPHPTSTDGTTLNVEIQILYNLAFKFFLGAKKWADDSTQAEISNVIRGKISAANPNNILNSYKIFVEALPTFVQYLKGENDQNPQNELSSFFQELPDEYRDLMQ